MIEHFSQNEEKNKEVDDKAKKEKINKCKICGGTLSMYNRSGQCRSHTVSEAEDITKGTDLFNRMPETRLDHEAPRGRRITTKRTGYGD